MVLRKTNSKRRSESNPNSGEDGRRARFGTYFPQLFAYAHSLTNNDAKAKEIVVESFVRIFARAKDLGDEEFPIALFGVAREICREARWRGIEPEGSSLSSREREVIALVFDAQLNRTQVASLLRLKDGDVGSVLLRGLRKLCASMTHVQAPAFFRLS